MLDQCKGDECVVPIINIDNGVKEPTHGYQNRHTNQILIFDECVEVKKPLSTQVTI